MINVENEKIKSLLSSLHNELSRKYQRGGSTSVRTQIYAESNALFLVLIRNPLAGPTDCSHALENDYSYELEPDGVIRLFRESRIANPEERAPLFRYLKKMAYNYAKALQGDRKAFDLLLSLKEDLKQVASYRLIASGRIYRILALAVFSMYPELNVHNDLEGLMTLGDTYGKYCWFDMEETLAFTYGYPLPKVRKKNTNVSTTITRPKYSYKEALERIELLEDQLERSNAMIKDFEEEFEQQLGDSKTQELAEFFSKLNSDKYGRILDELFFLRKGIDTLRKEHYVVPPTINGLMIMASKLLQFVKDSYISPMMKVHSLQEVTAEKIETCIYEGSPFSDDKEIKTVRVISPGWIYKEKEIQISRPRVKEEK